PAQVRLPNRDAESQGNRAAGTLSSAVRRGRLPRCQRMIVKSRCAPHRRCPYRVHQTAAIARSSKRGRCLQSSREIAAQGTADMEDHETRRKIIRQWMALPKDKRHTADLLETLT